MFLVVPTFIARCLYVHKEARNPSSEIWNCEQEDWPIIFRHQDFYAIYGSFTCRKPTKLPVGDILIVWKKYVFKTRPMKKEYWRSTKSLSILKIIVKEDLRQLNEILCDPRHKAYLCWYITLNMTCAKSSDSCYCARILAFLYLIRNRSTFRAKWWNS
jgi:hypothetical protein